MFKKWSIQIFRYLFLLIFLGFFGSATFFEHVHIVDGISIVHSHPFKKDNSGNPTHTHTVNGFILIQALTSFTVTASSFIVIASLLSFLRVKISSGHSHPLFLKGYFSGYSLRGPPAWSLI